MSNEKILFIIDSLEVGGAEKSTLEICKSLKRFTPVVCALFKGDALVEEFRQHAIKVVQMNLDPRFYLITGVKAVKHLIEEENPQIVHATLARAEITARFALYGTEIPLVGSLVGDTYNRERYSGLSQLAQYKLKLFQELDRISAKRVTIFLSISEFLKKSYIQKLGIPAPKIIVVPRGREIKPSESLMHGRIPFVFLNVGRLIQLKGQADIIRAVALVRDKYPQVRLKIAGEGSHRPFLERLIKETGTSEHVELLGRISNVDAYLSTAQFFVFGSYYEGQGGAIVEAMLANVPIVASDIDVVKEALQDKQTAILYKVKDHIDLAAKMIWAIENPENMERMADEAFKVAAQRYNIVNIVQQHEDVYASLIHRP